MRKFLLPFAISSFLAAPIVACDVEPDTDTDTGSDTDTDSDTDTPTPSNEFYGVMIDDQAYFPNHRSGGGNPCATSTAGAHGADIDAVRLSSGSSTEYLEFVIGRLNLTNNCPVHGYADVDQAKGPKNGSLTANFVSLAGGFIIGEFGASGLEIVSGDEITVYEIGDSYCGGASGCVGDEKYDVYVIEEASCASDVNSCTKIKIGSGEGEANFNVSGF